MATREVRWVGGFHSFPYPRQSTRKKNSIKPRLLYSISIWGSLIYFSISASAQGGPSIPAPTAAATTAATATAVAWQISWPRDSQGRRHVFVFDGSGSSLKSYHRTHLESAFFFTLPEILDSKHFFTTAELLKQMVNCKERKSANTVCIQSTVLKKNQSYRNSSRL